MFMEIFDFLRLEFRYFVMRLIIPLIAFVLLSLLNGLVFLNTLHKIETFIKVNVLRKVTC